MLGSYGSGFRVSGKLGFAGCLGRSSAEAGIIPNPT